MGAAVSLVTPKDRARYYSLLKSLNRDGPLDPFPIAEETLTDASRRLAVTRKIDKLSHAKKKAKAAGTCPELLKKAEAMLAQAETLRQSQMRHAMRNRSPNWPDTKLALKSVATSRSRVWVSGQ